MSSIFIAFFILSSFAGIAQESTFERIGTAQGLSSNFVNCIGQSRDGYMWVGTLNGLQRYDGFRFTSFYRVGQKNGLPPLPVHQILNYKDSDQIWVMMGQNIGLFDTKTYAYKRAGFKVATDLPGGSYSVLYHDRQGNTFLLIFGQGILVYNRSTNKFERNPHIIDYPRNWKPTHLQQDHLGNFYISGIGGLGYYDTKEHKFYSSANTPREIPFISQCRKLDRLFNFVIDSRNRLFLVRFDKSGETQLLKIDSGTDAVVKFQYEAFKAGNNFELRDLKELNGSVVAYGRHILGRLDEPYKFINVPGFTSSNYSKDITNVFQVIVDSQENTWMATDNGLFIIKRLPLPVILAHSGKLINGSISAVIAIPGEKILVSSISEGVKMFSLGPNGTFSVDAPFGKIFNSSHKKRGFEGVSSMHFSRLQNKILMGCKDGLLVSYNLGSGSSDYEIIKTLIRSTICVLTTDRSDNLWLGSDKGIVMKIARNGSQAIFKDFKTRIQGIFSDSFGHIWISTRGAGLIEVDPRKDKILRLYTETGKDKINTNRVGNVLQINDSLLAVPTSANLNIINLKTHKVKSITAYDGLPQGVIESLNIDRTGKLWFSSLGGLCRYDYKKHTFKMFDESDGLPTSSSMQHALFLTARLSSGKILFSGDEEFVILDPDGFRAEKIPNKVDFTDIKLFDKFLSVDSVIKKGGLNLRHDQNSLTIFYASKSYQQRNKLKYYYKLDGAESKWTQSQPDQSTTFAALAPGKYRFMVMVKNIDGVSSNAISSLEITVQPAFWQTWWFKVLIIAICALPIYLIYKLRLKRILEVQKIREGVARDLHDDIGSTLTSINILSEMANLHIDAGNGPAKEYLRTIGKSSSQLMESMDDIVWSIKPANDQLPKVAARMREYTAGILEPQNIDYCFESNEHITTITLDIEVRRNLFLIFKEALNNISKYSKARKVEIILSYRKGELQLSVSDDGVGFDMKQQTDRNGVANMRKRTELLKGRFELTSSPGKGTSIVLFLPI